MIDLPVNDPALHEAFGASARPHLLMITNHGIHQWDVIPGLPDTGGQNVFVNSLSGALVELGFRVTTANRGGYAHPVTGQQRRGLSYRDAHQRIIYLEDSCHEFVAKEAMADQVHELVEFLRRYALRESIDAIVSHYWDGAHIGALLNRSLPRKVRHVWIPHSLGTIKKRNMEPARWAELRVDQRIATEQQLVPQMTGIAATSVAIRHALAEEYDHATELFLPPCVDPQRYRPREVQPDDAIWQALARGSGVDAGDLRGRLLVTEISRTDRTKRKDLLLRAFAAARRAAPEALLVLTIDDQQPDLARQLRQLIEQLALAGHVAVLGSVWELLPSIYAATDVYCTPSVMEGFGMSIQEAAACGVPAVSSDLVPFAVEYLLGQEPRRLPPERGGGAELLLGRGAVVTPADHEAGLAAALELLLGDAELRRRMGREALQITVPYFTWRNRTRDFLVQAGILDATQDRQ